MQNTSAFPFHTSPAFSLFGVNITADPRMEILSLSPGLMASSRRNFLGSVTRPAWSIEIILSFMQ